MRMQCNKKGVGKHIKLEVKQTNMIVVVYEGKVIRQSKREQGMRVREAGMHE